jgi:hypothetical protein
MVEPVSGVAPVTLVCTAVQANVVPGIDPVKAIEVAVPEQIVCKLGVAVAKEARLIVTVAVALSDAQPPLATILFLTVYVPGALAERSITPVLVLTNTKPGGVELNVPPNPPGTKVGEGLVPY